MKRRLLGIFPFFNRSEQYQPTPTEKKQTWIELQALPPSSPTSMQSSTVTSLSFNTDKQIKKKDKRTLQQLPDEIFQRIILRLLRSQGVKTFNLACVSRMFYRHLNDPTILSQLKKRKPSLSLSNKLSFTNQTQPKSIARKQFLMLEQTVLQKLKTTENLSAWTTMLANYPISDTLLNKLNEISANNLHFFCYQQLLILAKNQKSEPMHEQYFLTLKKILAETTADNFQQINNQLIQLDDLPELHPIERSNVNFHRTENLSLAQNYANPFRQTLNLLLKLDFSSMPEALKTKTLFLIFCELISNHDNDYCKMHYSSKNFAQNFMPLYDFFTQNRETLNNNRINHPLLQQLLTMLDFQYYLYSGNLETKDILSREKVQEISKFIQSILPQNSQESQEVLRHDTIKLTA